jgi:S1-C subfamily serine protease
VGLDDHRVVKTAVPQAAGGGRYKLGSGYLITNGMVLTAAHVLESAEGVTAREGQPAEAARADGNWQAATVAWVDETRDVAVLSCPELRAAGGVRWGRLTGSDPVQWGAAGFPVASADDAV